MSAAFGGFLLVSGIQMRRSITPAFAAVLCHHMSPSAVNYHPIIVSAVYSKVSLLSAVIHYLLSPVLSLCLLAPHNQQLPACRVCRRAAPSFIILHCLLYPFCYTCLLYYTLYLVPYTCLVYCLHTAILYGVQFMYCRLLLVCILTFILSPVKLCYFFIMVSLSFNIRFMWYVCCFFIC